MTFKEMFLDYRAVSMLAIRFSSSFLVCQYCDFARISFLKTMSLFCLIIFQRKIACPFMQWSAHEMSCLIFSEILKNIFFFIFFFF